MNPTGIVKGPGAEALVGGKEGMVFPHWAAMYTAVNQSRRDCPGSRQVMASSTAERHDRQHRRRRAWEPMAAVVKTAELSGSAG